MKRFIFIFALLLSVQCFGQAHIFDNPAGLSISTVASISGLIPSEWTNSNVVVYSWDTLPTKYVAGWYEVMAFNATYWTNSTFYYPPGLWAVNSVGLGTNSTLFTISQNTPYCFAYFTWDPTTSFRIASPFSRWIYSTNEVPSCTFIVSSTQGDSTNISFTFSTSTNYCPIAWQALTMDTTSFLWYNFYTTFQYAVPSSGTFVIWAKVRNLALTDSAWSANTVSCEPIYATKPSAPYINH